MSYLSLLFTSVMRGISKIERGGVKASERGGVSVPTVSGEQGSLSTSSRICRVLLPFCSLETVESMGTDQEGESNRYRLPSGITSLEHWLDLNA